METQTANAADLKQPEVDLAAESTEEGTFKLNSLVFWNWSHILRCAINKKLNSPKRKRLISTRTNVKLAGMNI